jgi:Domain of Unknown Function with PDB structure (DUF3857)/Transglutaminase-like superfamily
MSIRIKSTNAVQAVAVIVCLAGIGPSSAPAQTQAAVVNEAPYTQEYESHIAVRADRTVSDTFTQRFKILTPGAAASVGQQKLMFVEGAQTLSTLEAYTQKADGRRIPVAAKNILTQDSSLPQQPGIYFRDLKQRTIIFSDVGVGDTLVMTHRRESAKGTIFKHLTENKQFPRSAGYTSVKVTVEAPVSVGLHVKVTGSGGTETVNESGGVRRHTIVIRPDSFAPDEADAVSPLDRDPTVSISTFNSYEELGSVYGQNALPKASVTPAITALAGEITKGIADKKAQAAAIDAWMKKNIRYVAVYLSSGRVIPNDAMTVFKNKFGDCKDKTTLMAALLTAKSIAWEPALINLGNAYTLAEPATYAALNHVILYLPEFDVYDDPTAQQAAFGVLALQAYDKPVVRVSAHGAKLSRTPAMKPDDHTAYVKTIVNVAADGAVTGQTEQSSTGTLAMALRGAASNVQNFGGAEAARRMLQVYLTPGSGNFDLGNSAETKDPVSIRSSFTLDDRFAAPAPGTRTIISRGMPLTALPGNFLLGTRLNGRKAPFVCYAGRQTEDIEATFEPPLPLPLLFVPVTVDNPSFSYRSTMKIEGRTMKLHREFISRVEHQVCPPDLEAKIAAGLNTVRINVFSAFAFGVGQPNAAARPTVTAGAPQQNPPAAPKPATLDKYVDQVNMANALLAGKQAGPATPPAPPNPAAAQNQPAPQIPPVQRVQNAAAPSQPTEFSRVVPSGGKLRVEFLYSIQPDCSSAGQTTVRVLEKPQHGAVTVENGQDFTSFPKENQRYECNTHKADGTLVFYRPEPEFIGKDSITLDIIYPLGQSTKRHYSIDVR